MSNSIGSQIHPQFGNQHLQNDFGNGKGYQGFSELAKFAGSNQAKFDSVTSFPVGYLSQGNYPTGPSNNSNSFNSLNNFPTNQPASTYKPKYFKPKVNPQTGITCGGGST